VLAVGLAARPRHDLRGRVELPLMYSLPRP
jgi:hypothetical protein